MKKIFIAILALTGVLFGCKKDDTTAAPQACIKASVVDSSTIVTTVTPEYISNKLKTYKDDVVRYFDSLYFYAKLDSMVGVTIDSLANAGAEKYFIDVADLGDANFQPVFFKYCGSTPSNKSVYTGDAGHVLAEYVGAPLGGSGVVVTGNIYKYAYSAKGTYTAAVVAVNVSKYGGEIKSDSAFVTFTLK